MRRSKYKSNAEVGGFSRVWPVSPIPSSRSLGRHLGQLLVLLPGLTHSLPGHPFKLKLQVLAPPAKSHSIFYVYPRLDFRDYAAFNLRTCRQTPRQLQSRIPKLPSVVLTSITSTKNKTRPPKSNVFRTNAKCCFRIQDFLVHYSAPGRPFSCPTSAPPINQST